METEHLSVGRDFNPEVGFLRRSAFRRSYAQLRFSPRPRQPSAIRKVFYEASLDYITGPGRKLETREAQASFRLEFNSGDFASVEVTRSFEGLIEPFAVGGDVIVPAANYSFTQARINYQFGPQRPVNGGLNVAYGGFFDGTLTEVSWRGRVEMGAHYLLEPTISWNRAEMPWGDFTTRLVTGRFTWTMSSRRFFSVLAQYQSATNTLSTNARFRWEYIPGSELFVVYSDGRNTLSRGFPEMDNRSFIVKVTRLLRW